MSDAWVPLDPYSGEYDIEDEEPILTRAEMQAQVEFFKKLADRDGLPYDPEWERWIADAPME